MWHTSRGDRTLGGAEAVLVRSAIESMIDNLLMHVDQEIGHHEVGADSRIDCDSGIAAYDCLTISQRIALLYGVARHLLTETDQVMPLSAAAEATVVDWLVVSSAPLAS